MAAIIGDVKSKKLATAKIYFKKTGGTGHAHMGNVSKYSHNNDIQRAAHMSAEKGFKRVDLELVKSARWGYKFTLDEHTSESIKLLLLGTQGADTVQAANAAQAVPAIQVYKGKSYSLGKYGITAHALLFAAVAKTENVDFVLDYGAGILTILDAGSIADNTALSGTINVPQVTMLNFTGLKELRAAGNFIIQEFDQNSEIPRSEHTFDGQIQVTNWGDNAGEYNEYECDVLATGAVTIKERKD